MRCKIFLFIAIVLLSPKLEAQLVKDKDAFAKAYIKIFNQRENGFEALRKAQGDSEELKNPQSILPGSSFCAISSNAAFIAEYDFADSVAAMQFFREYKSLMNYTASLLQAKAYFQNVTARDTLYQQYLFYTDYLYTKTYQAFYFDVNTPEDEDDDMEDDKAVKKKPNTYIVGLIMHPGNAMAMLVKTAKKINDESYNKFISTMGFGNQNGIVAQKTTAQKEKNTFGSKMQLPGFATTIIENKVKDKNTYNIIAEIIFRETTLAVAQKSLDTIINKIAASLPSDYAYSYSSEDSFVEFAPSFNSARKGAPEILLKYEAVGTSGNTFKISLEIWRKF